MLVTLAEFKASPYWNDKYTDDAILSALRYAEQRFYEYTNRGKYGYWLQGKKAKMVLDGTGTRLVRTNYPVLQLISCKMITGPNTTVDITDQVRSRLHYLWYRGGFREGFANVVVEAYCGDPAYARLADDSGESGAVDSGVPEDVKEAILRLADLKLRRKRIAGEEIVERRPDARPVPPPTYTGDREVDGIIKTYTITSPMDMLDIRGPLSPSEEDEEF